MVRQTRILLLVSLELFLLAPLHTLSLIHILMTTVHSTTATQKTVDGPSMKDVYKRQARKGRKRSVVAEWASTKV